MMKGVSVGSGMGGCGKTGGRGTKVCGGPWVVEGGLMGIGSRGG